MTRSASNVLLLLLWSVGLPLSAQTTTLWSYNFAAGRTGPLQLPNTESDHSTFKYAFGGYAIIAKGAFSGVSRLPVGKPLANPVSIEATGVVRAGRDSGASWGIVFGADSAATSYFGFTINTSGEYALFKRAPESGHIQFVSPVAHPAIHKGLNARNTLGVRLDGTRVTLLANGFVLKALDVGASPVGQAMLLRAGPDKEGKMIVVFYSFRAMAGQP